MNRVGYVFVMCFATAVGISLLHPRRTAALRVELKGIDHSSDGFNVAAILVIAILTFLYWRFW